MVFLGIEYYHFSGSSTHQRVSYPSFGQSQKGERTLQPVRRFQEFHIVNWWEIALTSRSDTSAGDDQAMKTLAPSRQLIGQIIKTVPILL